jgi:hypothetical protein
MSRFYSDVRDTIPKPSTIWAVKAHYLLGLAYEKSGWNKKAIEQYEEFLEIWKDADPGIPEVEDTKQRLKRLRVESKQFIEDNVTSELVIKPVQPR